MTRTTRTIVAVVVCAALLVALAPTSAVAQEKKKKAIKTGHAAGIGALLGFALGGDPITGAAAGAALGAAGGMIANKATEGKRERKATEAERAEEQQKAELAAREARIAELERELNEAEQARESAQDAIVEIVGPDVWEGYKALRGCQHERAYLLAQVGYASADPYHRLGALWLEAMIAVDGNDHEEAAGFFQSLAEQDPEIDTVQQARLSADDAVNDMNLERAELGNACN